LRPRMKTELCQFSGFKIYPGHGSRLIRTDMKLFVFINGKSKAAFLFKKNPRKIAWTQIYRRAHKKGALEEAAKKKTRKTQKVQRAIVGASLETIKAKRTQKPEVRAAAREAALREIKEKKKAQKAQKKGVAPAGKAAAAKAQPKKEQKPKAASKGTKGGR